MPIEFANLEVRIVSPAVMKETRKRSYYQVAIVEVIGSKRPDHWYANMYPESYVRARGAFDHVAHLAKGFAGDVILIDGQVRKFAIGDSQRVVLDITATHPQPVNW